MILQEEVHTCCWEQLQSLENSHRGESKYKTRPKPGAESMKAMRGSVSLGECCFSSSRSLPLIASPRLRRLQHHAPLGSPRAPRPPEKKPTPIKVANRLSPKAQPRKSPGIARPPPHSAQMCTTPA